MYIDASRLDDLNQLKGWMEDDTYTLDRRRMFKRTYDKVMLQAQDRKLGRLRERLRLATQDGNKLEMWKIMNQIKDYCKEEKLEEGTI